MITFILELLTESEGNRYLAAGRCPELGLETATLRLDREDLHAWAHEALDEVSRSTDEIPSLAEVGRELYRRVLGEPLGRTYGRARELATQRSRGLRLWIQLPPEPLLLALPWELLHNGQSFLVAGADHSILRQVRPMQSFALPEIDLPLRLLFTSASPQGYAHLDVAREERWVRSALESLSTDVSGQPPIVGSYRRHVSIEKLLHSIRRAQDRGRPFHIWHHCGHGLPTETGDFRLLLEDQGHPQPLSSERLEELWAPPNALRLAVLNTCFSAGGEALMPTLARLEIPGVVGFRGALFDTTAQLFARAFYRALTRVPLDLAVQRARHELRVLEEHPEAWAQPVVVSRAASPDRVVPSSEQLGESPRKAGPVASASAQGRTPETSFQGRTPEASVLGRTSEMRFSAPAGSQSTVQVGRIAGFGASDRPSEPSADKFEATGEPGANLVQVGEIELGPGDATGLHRRATDWLKALRKVAQAEAPEDGKEIP